MGWLASWSGNFGARHLSCLEHARRSALSMAKSHRKRHEEELKHGQACLRAPATSVISAVCIVSHKMLCFDGGNNCRMVPAEEGEA